MRIIETLTVLDSSVENNTAPMGGGMYTSYATTIINSTISGNIATSAASSDSSGGGGIFNTGILSITDSFVINNTANSVGGGIRMWPGWEPVHSPMSIQVTNTSVTGNSAPVDPDCAGC